VSDKTEEERGEIETLVALCKVCGGWASLQANPEDLPDRAKTIGKFYRQAAKRNLRTETCKVKDVWAHKYTMCGCGKKAKAKQP
jgi:hypothetical protein